MYSSTDSDATEYTDFIAEPHMILDGTACMDEFEDVSIPRVKGLVELISEFFDN